ncbi:hypothetical protein GCM10027614_00650 [Micromonospora vulcania]
MALSATSGSRSTPITVDGSGFAPNEAITITFGDGLTVSTVRANGDGVVSGPTVSVPGTARAGSTSVTLTGASSGTRVVLPFTVN